MTPKSSLTVAVAVALLAVPTLSMAASTTGANQKPAQVAQASAATPAPSTHKKSSATTHKHAASSAGVRSAQEALNKHGAQLAVDGKMGPKTHAAIKDFQKSNNLKTTGNLDTATRKALGI